jgi:hypothetical protein
LKENAMKAFRKFVGGVISIAGAVVLVAQHL